MARRRKPKPNIALYAAFVLLCLTMITTHLTSGLYARYVTRASASDSARVIRFGNMLFTDDFESPMILPGVNMNKRVNIQFNQSLTETSVYIFVSVETSNHWSLDGSTRYYVGNSASPYLEWSVAGNNVWTYLGNKNGKYIYYHHLDASDMDDFDEDFIATVVSGSEEYQIKVSDEITEAMLDSWFAGDNKVSVTLQAYVVQSGGFENASDAWDSLAKKHN